MFNFLSIVHSKSLLVIQLFKEKKKLLNLEILGFQQQ